MTQDLLPPYINGRFLRLNRPEHIITCVNPGKPSQVLATAGWHKNLVSEVVEGMDSAFPKWRGNTLEERLVFLTKFINNLKENAEELKSQMALELCRSRVAVEQEWALCLQFFESLEGFVPQELAPRSAGAKGWNFRWAPSGKVLISSNISLPVYALLSTCLVALAAGNVVCLRPTNHTMLSTSLLASAFHQADFPAGVIQIVYGDLEVYRRLVLSHQFNTMLYTGGEETLEQLRRDVSSQQNARLITGSGGKNAALVMPSAHIDRAIDAIVEGACADTGQRLESTGLVFLHKSLSQPFSESLVQAFRRFPVGVREDLSNPNQLVMGPLCSSASWERFLRFQGIAARESCETLRWGKPIDNPTGGFFVSPGVHFMSLDKLKKSVYASNAFFGPDVCLIEFEDASQAVDIINALDASRCLSVHSSDIGEVQLIQEFTRVPTVLWNSPTTLLNPLLPATGQGRAGEHCVSGVHFLFNTVFAKLLHVATMALLAFVGLSSVFSRSAWAADNSSGGYQKSVEGTEVVKNKMYPRSNRFQLNPIQGGFILNQTFVDTYLINLGATWHLNERHAINVDGFFGINSERPERACVEAFYYSAEDAKAAGATEPCDVNKTQTSDGTPLAAGKKGPFRKKPGYMAIRQIDEMFFVNYQWTPVYGKALWLLSEVGYLDLYLQVGLGAAMSTYWPKKTIANDNSDIRNDGVDASHVDSYGKEGRPASQSRTNATVSLGIGDRFFFVRQAFGKVDILANIEFRNFTVIDSDSMNFFTLIGGLGLIF